MDSGENQRAGIWIGLVQLVRLMVAEVADFEGQFRWKFMLNGEVPFLHHRIVEVLSHFAELER